MRHSATNPVPGAIALFLPMRSPFFLYTGFSLVREPRKHARSAQRETPFKTDVGHLPTFDFFPASLNIVMFDSGALSSHLALAALWPDEQDRPQHRPIRTVRNVKRDNQGSRGSASDLGSKRRENRRAVADSYHRDRKSPGISCVLTVAGSDSGGGAGIQADLKTITVLGGFGMSAITALTAQNTQAVVEAHPVAADFVLKQIEAIATDLPIHAAKTGMLANREIVEAVALALRRFKIRPLVLDPVLVSKGGHSLLEDDAREGLIRHLFPLARLITPNLPETNLLSGLPVETETQRKEAALRLFDMGPEAVLIKGGHGSGEKSVDTLYDGSNFTSYASPRFDTSNTHGTGCTFSAAIATLLAKGLPLQDAIEEAKRFITDAIRFSLSIGKGHGPTNPHAAAFRDAERFHVLETLRQAGKDLQDSPELRALAPEVQSNLGYALPHAIDYEEVAAFRGRIIRLPEGLRPAGQPAFGASRHIARVILAAMQQNPSSRAAINILFSEPILDRARRKGMKIAGFDRSQEPEEVKAPEGGTLEWGTIEAIRTSIEWPDMIFDRGEVGKEPMIRVLGTDPSDVLRKLLLLL